MQTFLPLFFRKNEKPITKVYLTVVFAMLTVSIYTDIRNSLPILGDLRNRQVGARMMKDGLSPYFYIWKDGDPIRYYDKVDPSATVSRATATPFFHHALEIVCDLPQFQLNILWLFIEYLTLAGTCFLAIFSIPLANKKPTSLLIIGLAVAFTYTFGWRVHVFVGQNYIFIPFLVMGCFYFLKQRPTLSILFLFATFAVSLILIRPVTLLFFLTFFFFLRNYIRWFLVSGCLMAAYCLFVFLNPVEKNNWNDYFKSIPIHVANHQKVNKIVATSLPITVVKVINFEGTSFETGKKEQMMAKMGYESECSNLFIFYNKITGKRLSINSMTWTGIIGCIILLLPMILSSIRKQTILASPEAALLLGFIVYYVFTFCLPIIKMQYNWVEFLFPFLLLPIWIKEIFIVPIILLVLGLYFNIAELPYIKMRHSVGEFMIVISLIYLVYRPMMVPSNTGRGLANRAYWL